MELLPAKIPSYVIHKKFPILFTVAALALTTAATQAQANYSGNGGTSFGSPVGTGLLTITNDATTLTGTIAASANGTGQLFDELVIYIDSKAGGFTDTSTFTDTSGMLGVLGNDALRKAISGFAGGTNRSVLSFLSPFTADFAIGISPTQGRFGALFTLTDPAAFTYGTDGTNGNVNLTPVGNVGGPYTFSIPLALIGVVPGGSFNGAVLERLLTGATFPLTQSHRNPLGAVEESPA